VSEHAGEAMTLDERKMRRLGRDPQRLDTLDLYTRLTSGNDEVVFSEQSREVFMSRVGEGLQQALSSRSTLHGFRTQYLFQNLVISLGKTKLIKTEDTGDVYITGNDAKIPDFRVVIASGENYLVEVKNFYPSDPRNPFRFRSADLEALRRYAATVATPLKIAIYWAAWNIWTLNDPDDFDRDGVLDFLDAIRFSEMATLGDYMIATEFPLQMVLLIDKSKARERIDDGFIFTVGGVEFRTAGRLIENDQEKNLAFFFMINGTWHEDEEGPDLELGDDGLPEKIVFTSSPLIDPSAEGRDQPFRSIGYLSELFSNHFNRLTLDGERVIDFGRDRSLDFLASLIPDDYSGQALRLWRFHLQKAER
jgi:hypothetical protein